MAIQLSNLTVNPEVKTVREYINTPNGTIEVYEPDMKMVEEILQIQEDSGFDFSSEIVMFDAHTMLTQVFPLLTNIETGELSEDELQKIIDNPSIHLIIAQNVVAQIISEANKLYAERMKTELASAESVLAQTDLLKSIPNIFNEHVKRNPEVSSAWKEIEKAQSDLENILESKEDKEDSQQLEPEKEKDDTES
ncbi:hypothetical protein ACP8H2_10095 [Bacillus subtilis]|uniref:hypothetical protein n=1 Tax=Bacillus subtilis TaxID=1423 RepID=UPI003CF3DA70